MINKKIIGVEISKEELMELREEGLSNREIANKLGISYSTVFNYIGKQPKENRGVYGKQVKPPREIIVPDRVLQMELQTTCYAGKIAKYTVYNMGIVEIAGANEQFTKDQLNQYIAKLTELYELL